MLSSALTSHVIPDFEPDEDWKAQLRKRIEEGMQSMVEDATQFQAAEIRKATVSAEDRLRLEAEHKQAMTTIKQLATEQYQHELARERNQRRWTVGAPVQSHWVHILEEEQQGIMRAASPRGFSPPRPAALAAGKHSSASQSKTTPSTTKIQDSSAKPIPREEVPSRDRSASPTSQSTTMTMKKMQDRSIVQVLASAEMSYTTTINVLQSITGPGRFVNVERTCLSGSYWTDSGDGQYTLHLRSSGTSGMLRFRTLSTGEEFAVAVGVHNYKRWCDIIPDFHELDKAATQVHPTYYGGVRGVMPSKQLASLEVVDKKSHKLSLVFNPGRSVGDNDLYAMLSISLSAEATCN